MSGARYFRLHAKGEGRMSTLSLERLDCISQIAAEQLDSLVPSVYPYLRHGFLQALEACGSVCAATGWQLAHRVVRSDGRLAGLMPLYLKSHSYGEYVFDFQWADA